MFWVIEMSNRSTGKERKSRRLFLYLSSSQVNQNSCKQRLRKFHMGKGIKERRGMWPRMKRTVVVDVK